MTESEKLAKRQALNALATRIRSMSTEEKNDACVKAGSSVTCDGHALSTFNTIFIFSQAGYLPPVVGGFRQWERNGRIVMKGQHSIGSIFVPIGQKVETDEDGKDHVGRTFFKMVPVFAAEQTIDKNETIARNEERIAELESVLAAA